MVLSKPKVVKLKKIVNGMVLFTCSCGKLSTIRASKLTTESRCVSCRTADSGLSKEVVDDLVLKELFLVIANGGLYEFIERIGETK